MTWKEAAHRVEMADEDEALPPPPPARPRAPTEIPHDAPPYIFTDRFDLTQLDLPSSGATIRIRNLQRLDVMEIMHEHPNSVPIVSIDERGQSSLEKELHLAPGPRATLSPVTKLVVMRRVAWNDVRWYLLEFLADGDGVVA